LDADRLPMAATFPMERRRVIYAGRVQGVGFRYTTVSIARRYPVVGYVENLRDGRVVVLAEGKGLELDRFLADLERTMGGYIREKQSETGPATGQFQGFQVQFGN
jgi:acylphosphatase